MVLFNNQLPGSAFGERYIGVPHDNDILSGEILQAKTELKAEPVPRRKYRTKSCQI